MSSAAAAAPALLAACIAIAGAPATAQDTVSHALQVSRIAGGQTGLRGGSGGGYYNLSCSEGQVLVGVDARAGWYVERLEGRCRAITATGAWTGSEYSTGSVGGTGGTAVSRRCPTNYAISGFGGRQASYVDQLTLQCRRLGSNGTFDAAFAATTLMPFGGTGGSAFGVTSCSRPARSITGRAGTWIDSIQLGCETSTPLMTLAQVDAALAGATTLLQTDSDGSATNDVACATRLARSGRVRIEPSNGLWSVDSEAEFQRACDLPGFVLVTSAITWCGGLGTGIIGCAPVFSSCQVVAAAASNAASLWAHEFGHTRGLAHRSTSSNNIMNAVNAGGGHASGSECSAYRRPL